MSVQIPVDILHHFLQLVLHQVCFHKILEVLIFLCLPPRICIQLLLIPWLSRPNHHQFRVPHQEIIVKQIHEIFQIILHRIRYHQDLNQFNNTIPIIQSVPTTNSLKPPQCYIRLWCFILDCWKNCFYHEKVGLLSWAETSATTSCQFQALRSKGSWIKSANIWRRGNEGEGSAESKCHFL